MIIFRVWYIDRKKATTLHYIESEIKRKVENNCKNRYKEARGIEREKGIGVIKSERKNRRERQIERKEKREKDRKERERVRERGFQK